MCSKQQIAEMGYKLFESYDHDNSGYLDRTEIKKILETLFKQVQKNTDCSQHQINKLYSMCDTNADNKLSRKQFNKLLTLFLEPIYL